MICRRCFHTFTKADRVAVVRGASVHRDKAVCKAKLTPYKAQEVAVDSKPRNRR